MLPAGWFAKGHRYSRVECALALARQANISSGQARMGEIAVRVRQLRFLALCYSSDTRKLYVERKDRHDNGPGLCKLHSQRGGLGDVTREYYTHGERER